MIGTIKLKTIINILKSQFDIDKIERHRYLKTIFVTLKIKHKFKAKQRRWGPTHSIILKNRARATFSLGAAT